MTDDFIKELAKINIGFEDTKGNFYSLKSYIKRIEGKYILIDKPSQDGVIYSVPTDQMINISINAKDGGVYLGESKVLDQETSALSGLWISYPHSVQHIQRREYFRVPLEFEAEIILYRDSSRRFKQIKRIILKDISGSGFSYISEKQLDPHHDAKCKIYLNDGPEPIISMCKNIYSKQTKVQGENKYLNAFIFDDIKEKDLEKIIKIGFKYQIELKKKGLDEDEDY